MKDQHGTTSRLDYLGQAFTRTLSPSCKFALIFRGVGSRKGRVSILLTESLTELYTISTFFHLSLADVARQSSSAISFLLTLTLLISTLHFVVFVDLQQYLHHIFVRQAWQPHGRTLMAKERRQTTSESLLSKIPKA